MNFWTPYLLEVLGDHDHGRDQAHEAQVAIRSLLEQRFTAQDLVRLFDWVEAFDSFRQLFILPTALELIADPSPSIRSRVLRFASELMGASIEPLVLEIEQMIGADRHSEEHLRQVLESIAQLVLQASGDQKNSPGNGLETLLDARSTVLGVSLLDGLFGWLKSRPGADRLQRVYKDFFGEDEQATARGQLMELLENGPLYIRYLIVRWIGRSATELSTEVNSRQLLFSRYRFDPAPPVAAAAVESYSLLTTVETLSATLERLELELRTCHERQIPPRRQPPLSASEAARCLSVGVLNALGLLARQHPSEPAPLAALRRVVTTSPATRLDLLETQPAEARTKILQTALALGTGPLQFRVRNIRRQRNRLVGDVGSAEPVTIVEPSRSLTEATASYWCKPMSESGHYFRLSAPFRGESSTSDLLGVIAPRIESLATCETPRSSTGGLRSRCEREISARSTWSSAAAEAAAGALIAATRLREPDRTNGDADLDALRTFLVQTAEAAEQAQVKAGGATAELHELRNRTRAVLLNHFATDEFFALLFGEGEADELRARLLTSLATAAMRSRDDDISYRWIRGNLSLLMRIATSPDYSPYDRGAAAAAVQLRIRGLEEEEQQRIVIDHNEDKLTGATRRVLPFLPDATLQAIYAEIDQYSDRARLASRPEEAWDYQNQLIVRSEVVARALESGRSGWNDVDDNVSICIAAAAAPKQLLQDTSHRRMAAAFVAAPAERQTGPYRRLFEQLLRTATTAQLLAVLRLVLRRGDPRLEEYLARLMERRLESGESELQVRGYSDTQALLDATARRTVAMEYLCHLARRNDEFFLDHLQRLKVRKDRGETDRVVAAGATVRRLKGLQEDLLPAELVPLRRGSMNQNIADTAADIVPLFVHHPVGETDLRCLATLQHVPLGTVDFHLPALSLPERRLLLDELLHQRKRLLLAARMVGIGPGGGQLLDLGVSPAGLPLQIEVQLEKEALPDDLIVVQVRRGPTSELVLTAGRFAIAPRSSKRKVTDLRGRPDAIEWLKTTASTGSVFLRAVVVDQLQRNDGTVRCFCNAGFRLYDDRSQQQRDPSFTAGSATATPTGTEIVLAASDLSFRTITLNGPERDTVEVLATDSGIEGGRIFAGYLRQKSTDGGRRAWSVEIGHMRLAIPRAHLTRDLQRLFALDALPDDAPILSRLQREYVDVRILKDRTSASVIEAPPSWEVEDLIIAVGSGAVEGVTVVRVDHRPLPELIVEVQEPIPLAEDLGDGPVLPLGTLGRLRQGDLFDRSGEPVALEALSPGARLSLAVGDRETELGPRAKGRPRPPIHLRLTDDPDQENTRIEQLFSQDELVSVRVLEDGVLELTDPPAAAPPPRVQLTHGEDRRYFNPGTTVEALVAQTWDPWALDYKIQVRRMEAVRLHIDRTGKLAELRFLLNLEAGDRIDRQYQYRRDSYDGKGWICLSGGLRVVIDPQTSYLIPHPSELQPADVRSQVLLTDVTTRKPRRESFPISAVPEIEKRGTVKGIVSSIPFKGSKSTQVGVHWILGDSNDLHGKDQVTIEERSLHTGEKYFNGDVLVARAAGREVVVEHKRRFLKGTFLHSPVTAESWLRGALHRRQLLDAVLLERPDKDQTSWLFCIEPADLVEVPPGFLSDEAPLGDAQPLDRVKLRIVHGARGDALLQVELVAEADLARSQGRRFELRFLWYDRSKGLFEAQLTGPGPLTGYPPLELRLPHSALPPGLNAAQLATTDFAKKQPLIECTLEGFELRTWRQGGFRFALDCTLGRYEAHRSDTIRPSKPSLVAALAERGRIDGARGKVVEREGDLAVVLNGYAHDAPLPLPLEEQTWLPLTGKLPDTTQSYSFAILPDENGDPFASLRRSRPKSLEEWLAHRRYGIPSGRIHWTMHYCGPLSDADLKECALDLEPDDSEANSDERIELVLFEVVPGDCFVAPIRQLRFLGEPFHPMALRRGDEISEFEIILGPADEVEREAILDILSFTLDIVEDLKRFDDGTFFAKVAVIGSDVTITELRGASYSEQRVKRHRLGRWQLILADLSASDIERLRALGEDQFVYLKFVRADRDGGRLVFRLASAQEIFAQNHFVFVLARQVSSYGQGSWKIEVRPLDESQGQDYFIPESLFSERRGRRREAEDLAQKGAILLAHVHEVPEQGKRRGPGSSYMLTLLKNPRRRFRYMMSHREWQVIVKDASPDNQTLYIEAGIGVTVELPLQRIGLEVPALAETSAPRPATPRRGEVLFLERSREERRLVIRDTISGHLDYLAINEHPLVLINLWGSTAYRRRKTEKDKDLDCSIVGLPQLHGLCQVREENLQVDVDYPLPAQVIGLGRGGRNVQLTDRLGRSRFLVGRLYFDDSGEPRFESSSTGRTYRLTAPQVSYRRASVEELARVLTAMRWRDNSTGIERSISQSDLVGVSLQDQGAASLTAMAEWPYPVDHLAEQFAASGPQDRDNLKPKELVVARVDRERLILEVAPGRYAELPTALIHPLHQDAETSLVRGVRLYWGGLAPGDQIVLQLESSTDLDAFLPRFRVRELASRSGHQLARPLAAPVCRRPDGVLVLGTIDGPEVVVSSIQEIPQSQVHDLRSIQSIGDRYRKLNHLFQRFGSRLVLKGSVAATKKVDGGSVFFTDIGIQIPVEGGRRKDPSFFLPAGDLQLERGQRIGLRVLGALYQGPNLSVFHFTFEKNAGRSSDQVSVRCLGQDFTLGPAQPGDSVLIYRPSGGSKDQAVAAGLEHLELSWVPTPGDDLHLHVPAERTALFEALLAEKGFLWATCETIDDRRLTVSRRIQLEDALPQPGEVVRAKLVSAVSRNRWLVLISGVPMVILSDRLFRGPTLAVDQLSDEYGSTFKDGLDLELLRTEDGRLSANAVYQLRSVGEVDARIEAVVEAGIMVLGAGTRFFIPCKELTWCGHLDEPLLRLLFRPGDRLRITRLQGRDDRWSHVATYDIRTQVAEMRRTQGAVSITAVAEDGMRMIVRGSSGVLMELVADQKLPKPGAREIAFLEQIDDAHHRIRLTTEPLRRSAWSLPDLGATLKSRIASQSQDAFHACLDDLRGSIASEGPTAVYTWAECHSWLATEPDNVRQVLDLIGTPFPLPVPAPATDSVAGSDLHRLLCRLAAFTTGQSEEIEVSPDERFAVGYYCLLEGQPEQALMHLRELEGTSFARRSFAVSLAVAIAYARNGHLTRATGILRELLERLWANAARTIRMPLLKPPELDPQHKSLGEWEDALAEGDLEELAAIVARQPAEFRISSLGLAFEIWRSIVEDRLDGFTDLVERFFDALRLDEEESVGGLDSEVVTLAALLEFSRGRVIEAWAWLDQIEAQESQMAVPAFWRCYLAGDLEMAGLDPVLVASSVVFRRCRWDQKVEPRLLDELWEKWRSSQHRWILDIPACRALSSFPGPEAAALQRWAKLNGVESALGSLLDDIDLDAATVTPNASSEVSR